MTTVDRNGHLHDNQGQYTDKTHPSAGYDLGMPAATGPVTHEEAVAVDTELARIFGELNRLQSESAHALDAEVSAEVVVDADMLEGACWEIPDDIDTEHAVQTEMSVESLAWWSNTPDDGDAWCACGNCPTTPVEMPANKEMFDVECDGEMIAHYAARIQAGDQFPPIQVFHDPDGQEWKGQTRHLLVDDGYHRISAYRLAGVDTIPVDLYAANYEEALQAAASPDK